EAQEALPEAVYDGRHPHRRAGMTGVRLLDGVDAERPDRVDTEPIEIVRFALRHAHPRGWFRSWRAADRGRAPGRPRTRTRTGRRRAAGRTGHAAGRGVSARGRSWRGAPLPPGAHAPEPTPVPDRPSARHGLYQFPGSRQRAVRVLRMAGRPPPG